ncbi:unnamed protein product [Merluccius merluccius]
MVIKEGIQKKSEEHDNPDHEELAAIARQFDKKYGEVTKKKDRIQDLVDIGYGYDDDDSFIDNSEAASDTEVEDFTTRSIILKPPKVSSALWDHTRYAGGGGGTGLADPLLSLIGSINDHALIQAAATVDFDIDLDSLLDATEDGCQLKTAQHATEMHLVMENQSTFLFQAQPHTELKSGLDPLEKLKEAIGKVMPEQIVRFHDNRQAYAQVKSTKVTEEKKTREQGVNVASEDGKRGPQKKFKWNEEIRSQKKPKSEKKMASINGTSNFPDGSAESPDGHFCRGSSPEETALSLDTNKKTLKEVLNANTHPHLSVLMGGNGVKGPGSEPPTLSETAEKPPQDATPVTAASTHSFLDLLAEQALAQGQLVNATISQKLKVVAASSVKFSDLKSPPLPPPAPHVSIEFLLDPAQHGISSVEGHDPTLRLSVFTLQILNLAFVTSVTVA